MTEKEICNAIELSLKSFEGMDLATTLLLNQKQYKIIAIIQLILRGGHLDSSLAKKYKLFDDLRKHQHDIVREWGGDAYIEGIVKAPTRVVVRFDGSLICETLWYYRTTNMAFEVSDFESLKHLYSRRDYGMLSTVVIKDYENTLNGIGWDTLFNYGGAPFLYWLSRLSLSNARSGKRLEWKKIHVAIVREWLDDCIKKRERMYSELSIFDEWCLSEFGNHFV